jgi:hypothetical protein
MHGTKLLLMLVVNEAYEINYILVHSWGVTPPAPKMWRTKKAIGLSNFMQMSRSKWICEGHTH